MVNIQDLLDDARCYETVRTMRAAMDRGRENLVGRA